MRDLNSSYLLPLVAGMALTGPGYGLDHKPLLRHIPNGEMPEHKDWNDKVVAKKAARAIRRSTPK